MAYDPTPPTNVIGCLTGWLDGLLKSPTPRYTPAPPPPPPPVPVPTKTVRVRAVEVERLPAVADDGSIVDGPIASLTLVVDDAATAATVLEAFHTGAQLRVVAASCG